MVPLYLFKEKMFKEEIKYKDFNGRDQVKIAHFHLSEAEILELELRSTNRNNDQGLRGILQAIIDSGDGNLIISKFKEIVEMSYGEKTVDGSGFMKSKEIYDRFVASGAYDKIFVRLVTDAGYSSTFVNNLLPAELSAAIAEQQATPGFRPGYDPNYRPTPPVAGQPIATPTPEFGFNDPHPEQPTAPIPRDPSYPPVPTPPQVIPPGYDPTQGQDLPPGYYPPDRPYNQGQ